MDPDRVRAYLQVACAGLGFDIGEIWWSSNKEGGSSTALAAIEEKHDEHQAFSAGNGKQMRFVQLYTSRSYENRRSQLVTPADEEENYLSKVGDSSETEEDDNHSRKKHVLSPLLVDAISKTAQVVWAHTKKQEGLLGRSDMKLQTAVGMPVAVDGNGNMCVVVMFSPNNIQSTDDAMEYLQSISRCATSTSIPSLLPAFDPKQGLVSLPHHHETTEIIPLLSSPSMSDGSVVTRFVSLDDAALDSTPLYLPEVHSNHDLANAPKDCFGIPMLPSVSLLDGSGNSGQGIGTTDAFDEASYGVWSTIMENAENATDHDNLLDLNTLPQKTLPVQYDTVSESDIPVYAMNKPTMAKERQDRLEEFAAAFLDVSVFELAEVWVPIGDSGHLGQVTSVISSDSKTNQSLHDFQSMSEKILVAYWSGAVGRAFSSGNPVWSANQDVFVDGGRSSLFSQVKIETALAVPVFSGKSAEPSFVFCCYSFVRSGSVPFVLKFAQQALRLLWDGLDKVQPHESVGKHLWKDVAPADLGEMAADVEMQQHFMIKKRPHAAIEDVSSSKSPTPSMGFQSLQGPSDAPAVRSIYTGDGSSPSSGPMEHPIDDFEPNIIPLQYNTIQSHIQDAVQSVGKMLGVHQHVATNPQGSKRAHLMIERLDSPTELDTTNFVPSASPLPMPRPLPLPNAVLRQPSNPGSQPSFNQEIRNPQASVQIQNQGTHELNNSLVYQNQQPYQQQHQLNQSQTQQQNQTVLYNQQQMEAIGNASMTYHQPQQVQNIDTRQQSQYLQTPQPTQQQGFVAFTQQAQFSNETTQTLYPQQQNPQPATHTEIGTAYSKPIQTNEPLILPQDYGQVYRAAPPRSTAVTSVSSISNDQISASGISFPVPQHTQQGQMNGNIAMPNTHGNVPVAPSPVTMDPSTSDNYCVPVTNGGGAIAVSNSNAKPCRIQGCNDPAVARRPYCVRHSGNRMCEHLGCSKCAQGSTRFCIAHGGGRRCTFPGCDKGARDKFFCAAHGGGKRCKFDGCNKSAVGGSSLCTAHGGGRRCSVEGCDKSAQSSTKFCVKHGGGKKCSHPGCEKVARGRTQYCAAHGGGVRCKLEGCNRVAIGKLQLCRAHGGGSRPRRSKATADAEAISLSEPFEGAIPGFDDMASV